jgi:formylglycine-generating enzyme required for sulfatase activity
MKNKTWWFLVAVAFTLICMCGNPTDEGKVSTFTLFITATNGTVTKSPDLAAYDFNSVVQITAIPSIWYHFVSWSGDTTDTANPLSIRMNSNKNLTANFTINTYNLTVSAGTGGTVSPTGISTVNHGAATSITATPDIGYQFARWTRSGPDATIADSTQTSTTVVLAANATVTAEFFTTNHAPNKPSNPVPTDGTINQKAPTLQLSWSGGDADTSDTVRYDVYLDTVNPPVKQVSSAQIDTAYHASGLFSGTTYYWYIVASDGMATMLGDIWLFVTNAPPVMKQIPSGTFQMGGLLNADERPIHSVSISSFYMDSTEVTQEDYLALRGNNPSYFIGDLQRPVDSVRWSDAFRYCNARSKRDKLDTVYNTSTWQADFTKNGYRLPTEAEWEYACRAGSTTDYYWGGNYPLATPADTAAMDSNVVWLHNEGYTTQRVAGKKPNDWGLYDMAGNVYEWINDWFISPYDTTVYTDPTGPSTGTYRVVRGCCYMSQPLTFRSAYRTYAYYSSYRYVGFRCVRR